MVLEGWLEFWEKKFSPEHPFDNNISDKIALFASLPLSLGRIVFHAERG